MSADDLDLGDGWIDAELRAEFPELRLHTLDVPRGSGRSPTEIRERLRSMSDRFRGATAISLRRAPIPSAYRVFFRQVGLDPDAQRVPAEEAAVRRLVKAGFESQNLLDDALLIALVETGVPLWALDAEAVDGPLGIRPARAGEHVGRAEDAPWVREDALVVADAQSPVGVLFEPVAAAHAVTKHTTAMTLFAVAVPDVPPIFVEEAMWTAVSVLEGGG